MPPTSNSQNKLQLSTYGIGVANLLKTGLEPHTFGVQVYAFLEFLTHHSAQAKF